MPAQHDALGGGLTVFCGQRSDHRMLQRILRFLPFRRRIAFDAAGDQLR